MMKKICTDGSLDNSSLFSAEAVVSNEDLVREIFLRLHVRSLIRFKVVSKKWFFLISDPQFAHDRTHRLSPNSVVPSGLFFYNSLTKSKEIESVSLDDSPIQLSRIRVPSLSFINKAAAAGSKITVLQSCNGLLLCRFTLQFKFRNDYCVCNPTTKKYKILPQLDLNSQEFSSGFTLAFDPSMSPHYKAVCLILVSDRDKRIEIYSSETGKWNTFAYRFDDRYYHPLMGTGIYWNSLIHWIDPASFRSYHSYIYDLEKNKFQVCDMPPKAQSYCDQTIRYFGECKGCLHLVYIQDRCLRKFQIIERDRETLKWSVKYRVHIGHLLSKFPEICVKQKNKNMEYAFSILSVYKGEKEEDLALVLTIPGKVVSYNIHYKTSKVLCELPSQVVDTWDYPYCTAFNFIETLASV